MIRAKYVAKEYLEKSSLLEEKEITEIIAEYEKINKICKNKKENTNF